MNLRDLLGLGDRLARRAYELRVHDLTIKLGRLTLAESFLIDQETGRNPILELFDPLGQEAKAYPVFSFSVQRLIFFFGLNKFYELTTEEAGDLFAALPLEKQSEAIRWILTGDLPSERPLEIPEKGKPVFRLDAWLPLLLHVYPGYTLRDLLQSDSTELALLIQGYAEVVKFYARLFGTGKKKSPKLAQPIAFLYPSSKEGK